MKRPPPELLEYRHPDDGKHAHIGMLVVVGSSLAFWGAVAWAIFG